MIFTKIEVFCKFSLFWRPELRKLPHFRVPARESVSWISLLNKIASPATFKGRNACAMHCLARPRKFPAGSSTPLQNDVFLFTPHFLLKMGLKTGTLLKKRDQKWRQLCGAAGRAPILLPFSDGPQMCRGYPCKIKGPCRSLGKARLPSL